MRLPGLGLVLVDTSIWIDLLSKRPSVVVALEDLPRLAVSPPILQEILQGIANDAAQARARDGFLALPCVGEPIALPTYLHAADLFRAGRRRGHTIRSAVDCLIAAIAIEQKLPVWHRDRDFAAIAKFTELAVVAGI